MVKREFKAQIVGDFASKWLKATAEDENITVDEAKGYYDDADFRMFAERVSGEIVTLTENEYFIGNTDYFEKIDDNHVMHPELWEPIK